MAAVPLPVRQVVCGALCFYCAGVFSLALWPTTHITVVEWIVAALCVVAFIGLVAHAIPAIQLPGSEYAYLVTGLVGTTSLFLFLLTPEHGMSPPEYAKIRITLLLLSGAIGAYGAFWEQEAGSDDGAL